MVNLLFLGVSCFIGLAVTCLFLPMNHFAGKIVVVAQENLMKARDERVTLMNEVSIFEAVFWNTLGKPVLIRFLGVSGCSSSWLGNVVSRLVYSKFVKRS